MLFIIDGFNIDFPTSKHNHDFLPFIIELQLIVSASHSVCSIQYTVYCFVFQHTLYNQTRSFGLAFQSGNIALFAFETFLRGIFFLVLIG